MATSGDAVAPPAPKLGPLGYTPQPQRTPRVVVLLSTYQGERFIKEQIDSILSQLPADGRLRIRDDGSRDRTADVVESIGDPRITLERGSNLGFGASFLTLLTQAPIDADMVMFSDQDDVWLPGKVERAWRHLQVAGAGPALYGSAQMLADASLRPLEPTAPWPRGPSLINAICENIITGCTAALNRDAVELLQRSGVPDGVRFHDWWMYLVISAFGTVVLDDQPTLLYRQHSGNQIGHGAGRIGRYFRIVRFLLRNDWVGILLGQLAAFLHHYGDRLDPTSRRLVLELFEIQVSKAVPRWRLIFSMRRLRQRPAEDLALRILLPLHRMHIWPLPGWKL
jgi:glycosyltransferase involved in cell wall biosynthesis